VLGIRFGEVVEPLVYGWVVPRPAASP